MSVSVSVSMSVCAKTVSVSVSMCVCAKTFHKRSRGILNRIFLEKFSKSQLATQLVTAPFFGEISQNISP